MLPAVFYCPLITEVLRGPGYLTETLVMHTYFFSYGLYYSSICCCSNRHFAYSVNIMWLQNVICNYFTTAGFATSKPHLLAAKRFTVGFLFKKLS